MRLPREHGVYNRGDDTPALTADIVPTLLQLAGLQPDPAMDGKSLLDLPAERNLYGETRHSVFATDGRFKYIYYFDGAIEHLFDLRSDSDDVYNLAGLPTYADTQAALKAGLIAYLGANERPAVVDGALVATETQLDYDKLRASNTAAWRGPLRYGQGYG